MITTRDSRARATVVSRLVIDRVTENERTFTCVGRAGEKVDQATTVVYASDKKPSFLTLAGSNGVLAGPRKSRIVQHYTTLLSSIGSNVVLPCRVTGRPMPDIFWLNTEGEVIGPKHDRFKVMPNGGLMIAQLEWNDMGTYTCIARNQLAKDVAETFVYPSVSGRRSCPDPRTALTTTSSSLLLRTG